MGWSKKMLGATLLAAALIGGTSAALGRLADPPHTVVVGPWPVALAVDARSAHVFVVNNTDGLHRGTVSVLNASTGHLQQTTTVGVLPVALGVDSRRGRVLVVNQKSGTVSILDSRTGQAIGTTAVGRDPTTIALDERRGRAVVPGGSGVNSAVAFVLDTTSGAVLRRIPIGASPVAVAVDTRTGHVFVASAGTQMCPSARSCHLVGSTISMLDPQSGTVVRTAALGIEPRSIAVDERSGRVFVTGSKGVSVLDMRSGYALHTIPLTQETNELAVDERASHVFVLCSNDLNDRSSVSMLDARSGRVLRTTPIGHGASPLAVDEQRGRLIVANVNDNTLSILDTRSGRLLRTMPTVVQGPTAITVAESTGHVFVANADVSNGPDSSTSNDGNLLTRLGHMGANGIKVLRRGWTGSVSMLDARVLR